MKKARFLVIMALTIVLLLVAGCSSSGNTAAPSGADETKTLSGTMDEIKDFMFVVEDAEGGFYVFPFDQEEGKPEGLEDIEVGDQVVVTYSGVLSEVDNFTGEIISVEKAE